MTGNIQSDWRSRMETEMSAARQAWDEKNDGRARACVRRAVGILLKEVDRRDGKPLNSSFSAVDRLRHVAADQELPENIRKAAQRLVTNINNRLSTDFTLHPIHDANILIDYFQKDT